MIRDHLIHLRCPNCSGALKLIHGRTRNGVISSGDFICRSCGYRGSVKARIPVLVPAGFDPVWNPPFQRIFGERWAELGQTGGWEPLVEKILSMPLETITSGRSEFRFKRAVFCGSDYYFHRFIAPSETDLDDRTENVDKLLAHAVEHAPRRILDIGSGTGRHLVRLAQWRPRGTLTACLDIDLEKIKILEGRCRRAGILQRVLPVGADARQMPFPPAHFDAVISINGLAHIEGIDRVIQQLAAVLKPGASLWLIEPVAGTDLHAGESVGQLILHMLRNHLELHHGAEDLITRLRKHGFTILNTRRYPALKPKLIFIQARV
ncbi:class I SAM-dependent methyltransferase [bacterium]|nr:class I SAM-dependent methyltransferase [candidate division CSSED10-310 bacterium]